MRRIGLTMHYRRFLPHCISSSHRNMSVISTKFNPIANKYEDDVRKCIANVSSITYMFTQTPLLTHSRTKVKETVTNSTISSLGCISSIKIQENNVIIDLDLLIAGYPHSKIIIEECDRRIKTQLNWVKNVTINLLQRKPSSRSFSIDKNNSGAAKIEHVIGVSSCKGGVGKSTIAANLALSLASKNLRVGILDADVYGPSIHIMIPVDDKRIVRSVNNAKAIMPLIGPFGLKMLSFGHVNPNSAPGAGGQAPAVMRGPIVSKVINQLVAGTEWGELDYLIVDMPPGTGDIQITLSQTLSFSGSVIVTTPHELSLVDAAKGVIMFHELKVPILAIAENMSYFIGTNNEKYYPFGKGGRDNLIRGMNIINNKNEVVRNRLEKCPLHTFPLATVNSGIADSASHSPVSNESVSYNYKPAVIQNTESEYSMLYSKLADDVIIELLKLQITAQLIPSIQYIENKGVVIRYFTSSQIIEYIIEPFQLRIRDPKTGKKIGSRNEGDYKSVKPVHFDYKGNYGVAINWSDGFYEDIFPYEILKMIAEESSSK